MKTLVAYYSKTGNTHKVAERLQSALSCDCDEIKYDQAAHTVSAGIDPAGYDMVILMCPIWAFRLPEPMTLYLRQYGASIKRYRLAVTCGGMGLRGCVSDCIKILGAPPEKAVKIREKSIKSGTFGIDEII